MEEKEYKRLLNKAATYCAKAEKSPQDVISKLRQWSTDTVEEASIEKIMAFLTQEKFVDENRYAQKYIGEKLNLLHKGPYMLSQELAKKGIPQSIIRTHLDSISNDEWTEALVEYLTPKLEPYRRKSKNAFDLRMRLSRAAGARGFSSGIIEQVISTFDLSVPDSDGEEEYYD